MTVHGKLCTPRCKELAAPSRLTRPNRPPAVECPHCGADAGSACLTVARHRHRLTTAGPFHPSRLEAAS